MPSPSPSLTDSHPHPHNLFISLFTPTRNLCLGSLAHSFFLSPTPRSLFVWHSPVCNGCSQNIFSVYVGTEEGGNEFVNSPRQNGLLLCAYANYPGATGTNTGMPYQTQLSCQAAGRYVWIVQNNTSLSFCEVEIWGSAPNRLFPLPYSNHWDISGATFVNGLTGWMVQVSVTGCVLSPIRSQLKHVMSRD
jgi:hypothetical protein